VETAVLIPVKAFHRAKARLSGRLTAAEREHLARWMATRVVDAVRPLPTFIACDDDGVAEWAESVGAEVLWGPGLGLNGAVDHGTDVIAGKGAEHVIITHGDLPLPDALPTVARPGRVVLVPDRRSDGTNVLSRPCRVPIPACYGPGSFSTHLTAALASGAAVSVLRDPHLSLDIDTIDDCRHPLAAPVLEPLLGDLVR
jgi:2-phospho-L-lactate guanylyltransferase